MGNNFKVQGELPDASLMVAQVLPIYSIVYPIYENIYLYNSKLVGS